MNRMYSKQKLLKYHQQEKVKLKPLIKKIPIKTIVQELHEIQKMSEALSQSCNHYPKG